MLSDTTHVIGRQILEIDVTSGAGAEALADRMSYLCRHLVPPLLEELFDRYGQPDHVIRLDRVELDLGHCTPDTFGVRLREALHTYFSDRAVSSPENAPATGRVRLTERRLDLLRHFLFHGAFPWWALRTEAPEALIMALAGEQAPLLRRRLREWLSAPVVAVRLERQLSPESVARLDELLWPALWRRSAPVRAAWTAFSRELPLFLRPAAERAAGLAFFRFHRQVPAPGSTPEAFGEYLVMAFAREAGVSPGPLAAAFLPVLRTRRGVATLATRLEMLTRSLPPALIPEALAFPDIEAEALHRFFTAGVPPLTVSLEKHLVALARRRDAGLRDLLTRLAVGGALRAGALRGLALPTLRALAALVWARQWPVLARLVAALKHLPATPDRSADTGEPAEVIALRAALERPPDPSAGAATFLPHLIEQLTRWSGRPRREWADALARLPGAGALTGPARSAEPDALPPAMYSPDLDLVQELLAQVLWPPPAGRFDAVEIDRAIFRLSDRADPVFSRRLREAWTNAGLRGYLLAVLSPETLDALLEYLAGDQWPALAAFLRDLEVLSWDQPAPGLPSPELRTLARRAALNQVAAGPFRAAEWWSALLPAIGERVAMPPAAVRQAFREALPPLLAAGAFTSDLPGLIEAGEEEGGQALVSEDILRRFLTEGVFDGGELFASPDALLAHLLDTDAGRLERWLRRWGDQADLAGRLAIHCSTPVLDRLIALLSAPRAPRLAAFLAELDQRSRQLGLAPADLREYGLRALLAFDPGFFDFTILSGDILQRIAAGEGWTPRELAARLPAPRPPELETAFRYLEGTLDHRQEQALDRRLADARDRFGPEATDRDLQTLADALDRPPEPPPWWQAGEADLDARLRALLAGAPARLREHWRHWWRQPARRAALIGRLQDATLAALLESTLGPYGDFVTAYVEAVGDLLRRGRLHPAGGGRRYRWEAPLDEAFREPAFDTATFTIRAGRRLAAAAGLAPAEFQTRLREAVAMRVAAADLRFFRLFDLLRDEAALAGESVPEAEAPPQPDELPVTTVPEGEDEASPGVRSQAGYADQIGEALEALQYLLLHGAVPAGRSFSRGDFIRIQERLIIRQPGLMRAFYQGVLAYQGAASRLVRHFPEDIWIRIVALLLPGRLPGLMQLWAELNARLRGLTPEAPSLPFYGELLLQHLGGPGKAAFQTGAYAEEVLRQVAGQSGGAYDRLLAALTGSDDGDDEDEPDGWRELLADLRERQRAERQRLREDLASRGTTGADLPRLEGALFVANAGLVILAPFLPRYFRALDLLEGRRFRDEAAAVRGALLLQYLASNRTDMPEHLLIFNKLLCGLPLNTPLPAAIEPTEHEQDVSAGLLRSVLQNWERMDKSSLENLQGAFLLRDGALREGADAWKLTVESRSYDVVLSLLPWTISMIMLPWMNKRIDVEWKTTF